MAINGLPPHLSEADVPEAAPVWRHMWLYSMLPLGDGAGWLEGYLTGYCKNCGRAFSQLIPTDKDGAYIETAMDIPQDGCLPPKGL